MRIYVGNLPFSTTEDELREFFGQHGAVTSAAIVMDRETGRPRGFGFVEMTNDEEARKAIAAANGQQLRGRPLVVNEDWARSVRELIARVRPIVDGEWPGIFAAFQRRFELTSIPLAAPLRHLGYFVVVEALLTHAPKGSDPADSLGRQLKTSIPLLSNRMLHHGDPPVPFADLDEHASPTKILAALYEYRSAIAHGAEPSFSGSQSVLGTREKVGTFLDVMTRRLLRHAVLEPQLVTDLKGPIR